MKSGDCKLKLRGNLIKRLEIKGWAPYWRASRTEKKRILALVPWVAPPLVLGGAIQRLFGWSRFSASPIDRHNGRKTMNVMPPCPPVNEIVAYGATFCVLRSLRPRVLYLESPNLFIY